jgi:hypothetical protein
LYESESDMDSYLKFIFPEAVSLERQRTAVVPKFFTFMCTNAEGINSYFHCLIYFEQFTVFDMLHDDDPKLDEMRRKLELRKQNKTKNRVSINSLKNGNLEPGSQSTLAESLFKRKTAQRNGVVNQSYNFNNSASKDDSNKLVMTAVQEAHGEDETIQLKLVRKISNSFMDPVKDKVIETDLPTFGRS